MTCHAVHYIQSQPFGSPRGYWDVDYLAKTYGAERSGGGGLPKMAEKPGAVAHPAAAAAIDAKALIAANYCMGCHAVDKKVVGPGFKEVVAKYRDKADGLSLVAHNTPAQNARSSRKGAFSLAA